jgi:hypothetical protein
MTGYTAIFGDGFRRAIKNSKRRYSHAWRATGKFSDGAPWAVSGFAGSKDLAERSMAFEAKLRCRPVSWRGPGPGRIVSTEIVPAVAV